MMNNRLRRSNCAIVITAMPMVLVWGCARDRSVKFLAIESSKPASVDTERETTAVEVDSRKNEWDIIRSRMNRLTDGMSHDQIINTLGLRRYKEDENSGGTYCAWSLGLITGYSFDEGNCQLSITLQADGNMVELWTPDTPTPTTVLLMPPRSVASSKQSEPQPSSAPTASTTKQAASALR